MKSPVLLLCLGCAAARDLDGDGLEDAAPEGSCCINGYGINFDDTSCGDTLAEVASCGDSSCRSPFVARYSLQADGEHQDAYDCVSFISEEDCNAYGALWSDNCPHYIPTAPPSPAGGLNRDLDGDGYEDAAAEGECCISGYGNTFTNEYNYGTTMAEVQAGGCCAAGSLLRYSLQPCGEDNNRWDCVSFVDTAACAAMGASYIWSADAFLSCPHTAASLSIDCDSALASGPFLATALLAAVGTAL
jgi:hypothetical protein